MANSVMRYSIGDSSKHMSVYEYNRAALCRDRVQMILSSALLVACLIIGEPLASRAVVRPFSVSKLIAPLTETSSPESRPIAA